MPILLAHGALGPFDELLFLGIAAVFLVMMGISWVKSRHTPPRPAEPDDTPPAESGAPGHFPLE